MSHCNIWRKLFSRFNFKGCGNQVKVNVMEAQSKSVQIWPYEKTKHFITTVVMQELYIHLNQKKTEHIFQEIGYKIIYIFN